jgi:hypothetical protein
MGNVRPRAWRSQPCNRRAYNTIRRQVCAGSRVAGRRCCAVCHEQQQQQCREHAPVAPAQASHHACCRLLPLPLPPPLLLLHASDNVSRMVDFSSRFRPRFLELMHDVDDGVAAAGLRLLALLVRQGVVQDAVRKCLSACLPADLPAYVLFPIHAACLPKMYAHSQPKPDPFSTSKSNSPQTFQIFPAQNLSLLTAHLHPNLLIGPATW